MRLLTGSTTEIVRARAAHRVRKAVWPAIRASVLAIAAVLGTIVTFQLLGQSFFVWPGVLLLLLVICWVIPACEAACACFGWGVEGKRRQYSVDYAGLCVQRPDCKDQVWPWESVTGWDAQPLQSLPDVLNIRIQLDKPPKDLADKLSGRGHGVTETTICVTVTLYEESIRPMLEAHVTPSTARRAKLSKRERALFGLALVLWLAGLFLASYLCIWRKAFSPFVLQMGALFLTFCCGPGTIARQLILRHSQDDAVLRRAAMLANIWAFMLWITTGLIALVILGVRLVSA